MKKMIGSLLIFLFAVPVFSQRTVRTFPDQDNDKAVFTNIAAGGSLTHDFIFGPRNERHGYNGFCSYYAWADTADGGAGARDSLTINVYVLVYDEISGQYEIGSTALFVTDKDSINVADNIDWGANHSDNVYTISKVLNVQNGHGVRAVISNAGAALNLRDEVHFNQGVQ